MFCHKDFLEFPTPAASTNFDDIAGLQSTVDKWTSLYAATSEMHDKTAYDRVGASEQVPARGIEVGHIFYFGAPELFRSDEGAGSGRGKPVTVHMGSYGIGPTRVVAAIIEASHDANGIVWPVPVAPFEVGLINLKAGDKDTDLSATTYTRSCSARAQRIARRTDERAGGKFATMD